MKKILLSIFTIIIMLVIGVVAYGKYKDYKINQDIEKITNMQNQNEETEILDSYNNLLSKYNNNSKIYLSLSSYYGKKDKLDKAIDTLYLGLDQNKDDKTLTEALTQKIKDATVEDGYVRVTKGSTINSEDKVSIKTKSGARISLKLNLDTDKIDTSKESVVEVQGKEKYTGIDIKLDVEVLEFTGNTMANNLNGGRMAFNDGWIYFNDTSSKSLYKMKEDLSEKTLLDGDVEPAYINIQGNNLFFIDTKSGQYGSLVKTDLEGKNKQVIRQNTEYAYIVGESLYYTEVKGEHNGWRETSLNKMNLNFEDVEKGITTCLGSIQVINNKYIYLTNKYGGFIESERKRTWGDTCSWKQLISAETYKGEIYGATGFVDDEKNSFGKLNIGNNTQDIGIEKVDRFNSIGKDVYYLNKDGIFMASIDGSNKAKIMDIDEEPYKINLYSLANKIYAYSDEIKIVEKEETTTTGNTPDIKNEDIITLCNNANKLLLNIQDKRGKELFNNGINTYSPLEEPYSSKAKMQNFLSQYFTKSYVEKFMGGSRFIEKDGKLYFLVGDSGMSSSYNYTSIKTRENKGNKINAVGYAIYDIDNSSAEDGEIKLKVEDGKWKIDSFHSIMQ